MYRPATFKTLVPLMLLAAAAAVAPAIASAAAPAATPGDTITQSTVVSFRDLDLSKPEDAARLYARIRQAAASVCPSRWEDRPQRGCYDAAVAAAVARINKPLLSARHQQHGQHAHGPANAAAASVS